MQQNPYQALFNSSFDTYKVLDNLTLKDLGMLHSDFPKTIWQILNHLVKWQAFELVRMADPETKETLDEQQTWIEEDAPTGQDTLDNTLALLHDQHVQLANFITALSDDDRYLQQKLKIVQDLSVHLSFHVGELVLMRRLAGTYPLPHQMAQFLNE